MEMKTLSFREAPLRLYGVPDKENMIRVPADLCQKLAARQAMASLGRRTPGARVRFRTDASSFTVTVTFDKLSLDRGMSIYACQSAAVFSGEHPHEVFRGLISPASYEQTTFSGKITTDGTMQDVTVFLPRNEHIENVTVTLPAEAAVEPPTPYRNEKPILFYGSSITEGGCSENVANAYTSLVSRWLDTDFLNFGFSGAARGDAVMADFVARQDPSAVIMDYDHNAPDLASLVDTHLPFYRRLRALLPKAPILMMSRPFAAYLAGDDNDRRRAVVRATYETAKKEGDEHVYYIDGASFFPPEAAESCLVDGIHPNDLGFWFMARRVEPVLRKILYNE